MTSTKSVRKPTFEIAPETAKKLGLVNGSTQLSIGGRNYQAMVYKLGISSAQLVISGSEQLADRDILRGFVHLKLCFYDGLKQEKMNFAIPSKVKSIDKLEYRSKPLYVLELHYVRESPVEFSKIFDNIGNTLQEITEKRHPGAIEAVETVVISRGIKYPTRLLSLTAEHCIIKRIDQANRLVGIKLVLMVRIPETGEIHEFFGFLDPGTEASLTMKINLPQADQSPRFDKALGSIQAAMENANSKKSREYKQERKPVMVSFIQSA
jgi:hypothetical protein